jgi:3-mercaptopyruvate sulfurtransferase SseA
MRFAAMEADLDWNAHVKGMLKAELKRRNLSYKDLADMLGRIGVEDSERNITNKVNRGTFTAAFFVQCLEAIGCQTLRIKETAE